MTAAFTPYPEWLPDPQQYAVEQERYRQEQAVFHFGEYVYFVLLWDVSDFEAGLVTKCARCYLSRGKIAEVYGQAADSQCLECLGTTFEGGFKAIIVRPAIVVDNVPVEDPAPRGEIQKETATVSTTHDFKLRTHDVMARANGERWRVGAMNSDQIRTGFEYPANSHMALNVATVTREDESSVFYRKLTLDIPALNQRGTRTPTNFAPVEIIRGPLN